MKRLLRVFISIVLLLVSLGVIIFLVWPSYQELSSLETQITTLKERIETGEETIAKLKKTQEKLPAHKDDFAKIEEALPADAGLPVVYDLIQELGVSSGLVLGSISGEERGESGDPVVTLAFQVSFSGSYEALKNFTEAVRRSGRLLSIRSVSIGASGEPDILQVSMKIFAYAAK